MSDETMSDISDGRPVTVLYPSLHVHESNAEKQIDDCASYLEA